MRSSRLGQPAVMAVVLLLVFASGVLAGSGRGATFNLGVTNSVSGYLTKLTGAFAGPMLQVVNTSTAAAARAVRLDSKSPSQATLYARNTGGGAAAEFVVNAGKPPFKVNSTTKVMGLNADQVDGHTAGCPAGTVQVAAGCLETAARTAGAAVQASDGCQAAGRLLPDLESLRAARGVWDGASHEWTSSWFYADGVYYGWVVADNGAFTFSLINTSLPYRCLAPIVQ